MLLGQIRSYSKISRTEPLAIILSTVIEKCLSNGDIKIPKMPWCLNLFQSELCLWYLQYLCSLGPSLLEIWYLDKKYCTIISPKLYHSYLSLVSFIVTKYFMKSIQGFNLMINSPFTCAAHGGCSLWTDWDITSSSQGLFKKLWRRPTISWSLDTPIPNAGSRSLVKFSTN